MSNYLFNLQLLLINPELITATKIKPEVNIGKIFKKIYETRFCGRDFILIPYL